MKLIRTIAPLAVICATLLSSCNDADVASHNLSKAADNFQVNRRIVVINGITDNYLLSVEGLCSLGNADKDREISITCKTGPDAYKKFFAGLSDNVTYVVEQLEPMPVSVYRYKVIFKPSVIIPDIDLK
ncbi:hypothetical protein [Rhizobium tropici]|uniref:beta-sandwich lipoprotein n=1 Tax=Rhizobium tropici TaxID=398 RepID=UPI001AEC79D1|nr:hypothetical protein [Rhizobium tropici]